MAGRWVKEVSQAIGFIEDGMADWLWLIRHFSKAWIKSGDELDRIALEKLERLYSDWWKIRAELPAGREFRESEDEGHRT